MAVTDPSSQATRKGAGPSLFRSRFAAALAVFVVVNLAASARGFGRVSPLNFPELSWAGWAITDLMTAPARPNVVFLGSSLVLVPIAGADADYLGRRLDGSQHHNSVYFEDSFRKRTGAGVRTFNLALPGEMPSDAYLITDFLLKGSKRPDVLVYGVGPRDFMDNVLPSPASTDPFRNLARFGDITPLADRVLLDWSERLNFELARAFYLYGRKTDTGAEAGRAAAVALARLVPAPAEGAGFTSADRRRLFPDYRVTELSKGEAFFRPTTAAERKNFIDNLDEYRKRYKKVKWPTFVNQMEFLAGILDSARREGTHVVIASMPITEVNRSLIPPYAYDAYKASIHSLARAKGATFVDLQNGGGFVLDDFGDTVHLHSGGGKKMLDLLVERLSADRAVRASLRLPTETATTGSLQ